MDPRNYQNWVRVGGVGLSGTEGGRTHVKYFTEEGVFFKNFACTRFVKEGYFFEPRYEVWGGGGENPLTIHKIFVALTPTDFQSDWTSESAVAKQAEDYKI